MNDSTLKTMFSRKSDDWATPKDFYDKLDKEFNFSFDPCPLNAEFDGLSCDWPGNVFINPPYSNIRSFLEKGLSEKGGGEEQRFLFILFLQEQTRNGFMN